MTGSSSSGGNMAGTLGYKAPETYTGRWTAAGDVFSFGMVIYFLISGKQPFQGESQTSVLGKMHQIAFEVDEEDLEDGISAEKQHAKWKRKRLKTFEKRRPDTSFLRKDCPEALCKLMLECWSDDPAARSHFADIAHAVDGLKDAARDDGSTAFKATAEPAASREVVLKKYRKRLSLYLKDGVLDADEEEALKEEFGLAGVTAAEHACLVAEVQAGHAGKAAAERAAAEKVQYTFGKLDAGTKGFLLPKELKACLRSLGYVFATVEDGEVDAKWEAVVSQLDPSGDGVSLDALLTFVANCKPSESAGDDAAEGVGALHTERARAQLKLDAEQKRRRELEVQA
eukprot:gene28841-381_t